MPIFLLSRSTLWVHYVETRIGPAIMGCRRRSQVVASPVGIPQKRNGPLRRRLVSAIAFSVQSHYSLGMDAGTNIKMDVNWFNRAICRGKLDLFFPKVAERPQRRARREAEATALCRQCPVSAECREYGRNNREYGVWGGETEIERHEAGFELSAIIGLRKR